MHRDRVTAAVVAVGLVVTVAAGVRVEDTRRDAREQRLLVDAVTYAGEIHGELERHVGAAYALRDLFDDGPVVTRAQFERAIEALGPEQFPALHGLTVVRPVAADDEAAFVREKRADGYPGYHVADRRAGRPGDARWLVSLAAPYDEHAPLLGLDVRDHPGLEDLFARARDLGTPSLGPVVVGDGEAADAHVGLAVPVYAMGEHVRTRDDRREHLVGWVVSTVRTEDLVAGLDRRHELDILVVDETDGATIGRSVVAGADHGEAAERTMDVFGRRWSVRVAPAPGYLVGTERYATVVVVALGLLLTAALGGLVHVLGRRSAHARRLVAARTRELAASLDELRRHAAVERLVQAATWHVSQAVALDDALERLRGVIADVASFDRIGYSVRLGERRLRVEAVVGPAGPLVPAGSEYEAGPQLVRCLSTGEILVVPDTAGSPVGSVEHGLANHGIRGIAAVPLVARGEVAGILTFATLEPLSLPAAEAHVLQRVAESIAGPLTTLLALEAERSAAEQLRQLDELKDEFVGVVAHDLRAPLAVLTGYTDLLLAECDEGTLDPGRVGDGLRAMHRAARNQERLIGDLLESQRLALGVAVPERSPTVVSELVRETVADLSAAAAGRCAVDDRSDGAVALADGAWIRRVVANLVTNAWTYGGPEVTVAVTVSVGRVRVSVHDDGPGLDAADLPRLFQRFSRLGGGRGRPAGTGLGLYICKQLVEAHGGRVGVDSVVGSGSTFWFELPTPDRALVAADRAVGVS